MEKSDWWKRDVNEMVFIELELEFKRFELMLRVIFIIS